MLLTQATRTVEWAALNVVTETTILVECGKEGCHSVDIICAAD